MSAEASAASHGTAAAHAGGHGDGADRFLQHHFQDLEVQAQAARLGMWLFLSTEILLFGGLFVGYSLFRAIYPEGFHAASHHLSAELGLVDTFILITSSFTMAMSIYFVHKQKKNTAVFMLVLTILLGLSFLGVHG